MGKLVVVNGMDEELEEGLDQLRRAGVDSEAFSPYAVRGVDPTFARTGAVGYSHDEIAELTGARGEEARHLLDIVTGGGSLLVVEGDDQVLDAAQRALGNRPGQGALRH